jgi:fermentation-respiration switch protein FrsA (DUF1100 family)
MNKQATVTVLFSHGNAEDIGLIYDWFTIFSDRLNVNVFLYEYEGYGRSRGNRSFNVENKPNDASCYEDIDAAWNYLTKTLRVDSSSIVIYGRSLGSGPSCYLAERLSHQHVTIGGLVLQSPLLSVYRVAFDFRFTLPWDMFPNVDRVANITTPTWILHGTKDEIVPFWNGEQLFLACPLKFRAKPYWADGAGHNNVESLTSNSGEFFHQFSNFLKEHVPRYGGGGGSSLGG